MTLTRRRALLGAGAAAAGVPGARAETPAVRTLYEAALREGPVGWYSGILDQSLCDAVTRAFTARFPGVRVSVTKTTSQTAFQRVVDDLRSGASQCDVFTTSDVGHMTYLARKELLLAYTAEAAAQLAPELQAFARGGILQVSWIAQVALLYNSARMSAAEAPRDWPDLIDDRWRNEIALGSPTYSGIIGVWSVVMVQRYGWRFFDKLNELNPLVGRSVDDAASMLDTGARVVAVGNPSTAARRAAAGSPLAAIRPASGTVLVLSPSAILARTRNPNAAKLFMEFLAGPEYSRLLTDMSELPLRPDVPPPAGALPLGDMSVLSPTIAEIEQQLPVNKQKWHDTFDD